MTLREARGNTHQYRKRIVKNARKAIFKINREFLGEWNERRKKMQIVRL